MYETKSRRKKNNSINNNNENRIMIFHCGSGITTMIKINTAFRDQHHWNSSWRSHRFNNIHFNFLSTQFNMQGIETSDNSLNVARSRVHSVKCKMYLLQATLHSAVLCKFSNGLKYVNCLLLSLILSYTSIYIVSLHDHVVLCIRRQTECAKEEKEKKEYYPRRNRKYSLFLLKIGF